MPYVQIDDIYVVRLDQNQFGTLVPTPEAMQVNLLDKKSDLNRIRGFIKAPFTFVQVALLDCGPGQEMKQAIETVQFHRDDLEVLVFELSQLTDGFPMSVFSLSARRPMSLKGQDLTLA